MAVKEEIIYSLDGNNIELLEFIPYILQDFFEIGSDPKIISNLIAITNPVNDCSLIDLGCGKGAVAIEIAKRFNMSVLGIDAMAPFITEAKKKAEEERVETNCNFIVGDIKEYISSAKELFDYAVWGSVGDIIGDNKATLIKIAEILKPKGYVIYDDGYIKDKYKSEFTDIPDKDSFISRVAEAGFKIVKEVEFDSSKMKIENKKNNFAIKNRCDELSSKYPAKKYLFEEYVKNQLEESENLNHRFISVTLLLKREQ